MTQYKDLNELIVDMKQCTACKLRAGCTQVVCPVGQYDNPALVVVNECPGSSEDEAGETLIGPAGQCLREAMRKTKILNQTNTLLLNVLNCQPPGNKFPKNKIDKDCPKICMAQWTWNIIELAKPKKMLLLGAVPLKFIAELDGITKLRGQWLNVRGIRTLATFHPSYILRMDNPPEKNAAVFVDNPYRKMFISDINEIAKEVGELK